MQQTFNLQPNMPTSPRLAIPVFLGGSGQQAVSTQPAIEFDFNSATGELTGINAKQVNSMVQQAYQFGVEVIHNFNYSIEPPLTLAKLGTILAPYYQVQGKLPEMDIPESLFEEPEGAVS